MGDTLTPNWQMRVNETFVGDEITRFVQAVEFESADGMADLVRLRCVNPESFLSDAKVFQPGNEIAIFFGYGVGLMKYVGTCSIVRCVPNYPQEGAPTLQVVGYSRDHEMMDTEPAYGKQRIDYGRNYGEAVWKVASRYGFNTDIDKTSSSNRSLIQKAGMKDYEFVKGISNIIGYLLWVDADITGKWWLHLRNPKGLNEQEKKYTFRYSFGDPGSLLTFTPELLVKGAKTNLVVVAKDAETGTMFKAEINENYVDTPEMDASGVFTEPLEKTYSSASSIKLYFNDYSLDVVTGKKFTAQAEVVDWAQQWFRRMRENFISSQGRIIGNEYVMARQTHNIEGIGPAYDGEYYFSRVKHIFSESEGYVCDFNARKIVK